MKTSLSTWRGFIIYGIVVSIGCVFIIKNYNEVKEWPAVEGTITFSDVKEDKQAVPVGGKLPLIPIVRYEYIVAGKKQVNNRISYLANEESEASYSGNKYSLGEKVSVYYNPKKPEESFLVPLDPADTQWISFILFLHVLLVIVGGVNVFRGVLKTKR